MSIKKSLVQISTDNFKKDSETIFKIKHKKHTPYGFEMINFNIKDTNFGIHSTFKIPLISDLLHRCFIEIDIPNLDFDDNIIKIINQDDYNEYINNSKNIILNKIQNNINYWDKKFEDFKKYSNIQIEIYNEILKNIKINNISLMDDIIVKVITINQKYKEDLGIFKNNIENDIITEIDILDYIINYQVNTNLTDEEIKNDIEKNINIKYQNINNYLEYYYHNKLYYQNLYNDKNKGKIFYKWIDNLAHYYISDFEFIIGDTIIDSYSSDYLHIKQKHSIYEDNYINYTKLIRNNDSLYDNNYYKKKIYIPLLFNFCTEGTNNVLPLNALHNTDLSFKIKLNEIENLIYFKNWKEDFENNLVIDIPRKDHNKIKNNIIKKDFSPFNPTIELLLPQYIYRYKFDKINRFILAHNFEGLDTSLILSTYGIDDNDEKVMGLDEWIFMKNNLKLNNDINKATKISLLDYHYFIDYNFLLNQIPKPNIYINLEYGYLDNVENHIFRNLSLEYIIQTRYEEEFEINKDDESKTLQSVTGLIKELYLIIQPKSSLNIDGYDIYSESKFSNYDIKTLVDPNLLSDVTLNFGSQYDLIKYNDSGYNNLINTIYLKSELPNGIFYRNFSIYPQESQPSGSINLSSTKSGQSLILNLDEDIFNKYLQNKNNINNLGLKVKLIYVTYKLLGINNGTCELTT